MNLLIVIKIIWFVIIIKNMACTELFGLITVAFELIRYQSIDLNALFHLIENPLFCLF